MIFTLSANRTNKNNIPKEEFISCKTFLQYSRTPLLRPPSESHWCGRKRGVVVHEGLDYFITCALRNTTMHRSIVHTEHCFWGVPLAVEYRAKHSDQSTAMSSGTYAHRTAYVGLVSNNNVLYVNCAALYGIIPQSFVRRNNSNGPFVCRVWGIVVSQGPHKQKTLSVT